MPRARAQPRHHRVAQPPGRDHPSHRLDGPFDPGDEGLEVAFEDRPKNGDPYRAQDDRGNEQQNGDPVVEDTGGGRAPVCAGDYGASPLRTCRPCSKPWPECDREDLVGTGAPARRGRPRGLARGASKRRARSAENEGPVADRYLTRGPRRVGPLRLTSARLLGAARGRCRPGPREDSTYRQQTYQQQPQLHGIWSLLVVVWVPTTVPFDAAARCTS